MLPEPEGSVLSITSQAQPVFVVGINAGGTVSAAQPARRGGVVELFGPAEGLFLEAQDEQSAMDIRPPASGSPLYFTTSLPQVRIGGVPAEVLFSGLAPGLTGVWQIRVRVPQQAAGGRVTVQISYEGQLLRSVDLELE